MICVHPLAMLRGSVQIPSSKPHSQRALLLASLADGESRINCLNTCSETAVIVEACQAFGAILEQDGSSYKICGVGGKLHRPRQILHVAGSGFALRNLVAMASLADGPTCVMGDKRLAQRPLLPLIKGLSDLGVRIESFEPSALLPLVNWGGGLKGGTLHIPADVSSQFASAFLLVAPYADDTLMLQLTGEIVGRDYVQLTISMMQQFGANVAASDCLREIEVHTGGYIARDVTIGPDVTSIFYFIAAAIIVDTDIHIDGIYLETDPFLDKAVAIGRRLGVQVVQTPKGVQVISGTPPCQRIELNVAHVPTLVPAIAALASNLPYGLRVTGAKHIQFHKTSRLNVLMIELEKIGFLLTPIYDGDDLDGFETDGIGSRKTDIVDSYGDHRLFMALFLTCLGVSRPTHVIGEETLITSFPNFICCFDELQVR